VYRRTAGRIGGSGAGMRNLVLSTTGRRSGNAHAVCLPYWVDGDDRRVVVASFAGAPSHPAWYHNLADRSVNPTVSVQVMGDRRSHVAEILQGDEYRSVWEALVVDRPFFADYQARTERQIPLVRFVPTDGQ
jgi:deazaflavin-dependent oxidoreductase (nitroreductase family)